MSPISENTCLDAVQCREPITVEPTVKLEVVAQLFDKHHINAAPVVDGFGKCVGIITSYDLVRFEANRISLEEQYRQGIVYDLSQNSEEDSIGIFGQPFDEVAYNMSTRFEAIDQQTTLREAAELMCRNSVHHLVIVDEGNRPIGIISSLDILADQIGIPVCPRIPNDCPPR